MLKKVMAMLASKYMAIKVRMRAIHTHLMIKSLLLRDKKMLRHLFHRRKCFKHQPDSTHAVISNFISTATTPNVVQLEEDAMEMEDDYMYPYSPSEDKDERDDIHALTIAEMKRAEEQKKEFIMEDDINRVADLFIQRFHNQIAAEATL